MLLLKVCFNGNVTPFWTVSYHVLTADCTVLTSSGQVLTVFIASGSNSDTFYIQECIDNSHT